MNKNNGFLHGLAVATMLASVTCFDLFVSGCDLTGSNDSAEVRLSIQGNIDILRRWAVVELTTPVWSKELTGTDFGTPAAPSYTKSFVTSTSGKVTVSVLLIDSAGSVATGSATLDARPDWQWEMDIVLANRNPFFECFGCTGYRAFGVNAAFQTTPQDSLYLVWGGNSIKHPVIY